MKMKSYLEDLNDKKQKANKLHYGRQNIYTHAHRLELRTQIGQVVECIGHNPQKGDHLHSQKKRQSTIQRN